MSENDSERNFLEVAAKSVQERYAGNPAIIQSVLFGRGAYRSKTDKIFSLDCGRKVCYSVLAVKRNF